MNDNNIKELKNLSKACHNSGILPIFLGILIIFIGGVNRSTYTIAVGLMVFIVGYAFVKIAAKINKNISK